MGGGGDARGLRLSCVRIFVSVSVPRLVSAEVRVCECTEIDVRKTQMLAAGDSRLCDKKDVILEKFDQLLRKLGGEELSLNISLGKMSAEWHAAMGQWLDSESTYRLRIEQAKEAKEGSKFAEQEYEKYRQAAKEAKENYLSGLKKHDIERQELFDERR